MGKHMARKMGTRCHPFPMPQVCRYLAGSATAHLFFPAVAFNFPAGLEALFWALLLVARFGGMAVSENDSPTTYTHAVAVTPPAHPSNSIECAYGHIKAIIHWNRQFISTLLHDMLHNYIILCEQQFTSMWIKYHTSVEHYGCCNFRNLCNGRSVLFRKEVSTITSDEYNSSTVMSINSEPTLSRNSMERESWISVRWTCFLEQGSIS